MNEFNPEGIQSATSHGDLDAAGRFILALAASLALHLALLVGVQIRAAQQAGQMRPAMEVRIERAMQAKIESVLLTESATAETEKAEAPRHGGEKLAPPPSAPAVPAAPLLPALDIPLIDDPTWYPARQVDVHPAALQPIRPDYPDKGVKEGVEGSVVLLLLIDEAGAVKEISVVEANPEGMFEESALAAFRVARFAPAQKNDRPVKSRMLIRVSYELTKRDKP